MIKVSRVLRGSIDPRLQKEAEGLINKDAKYSYLRLAMADPIHFAINKAYEYCVEQGLPQDWLKTVLVEWPHGSGDMVTYTQSPDKGSRGVQTQARLGRYLKRLIPNIPDPVLERLTKEKVESTYKILRDAEMLHALESITEDGPGSCMAGTGSAGHYECYTSNFGWALATRYEGNKLMARALVNGKAYIKIYGPALPDDGYDNSINGDDPQLREWLEKTGYYSTEDWDGEYIALIKDAKGNIIVPYIDGEVTFGTPFEDEGSIYISRDIGEYFFEMEGEVISPDDIRTRY